MKHEPVYLIDANVLIALVVEEHEFHDRARTWVAGREIAVCPAVEGSLVRYLVRVGEPIATVAQLLRAVRDRCTFWPDEVSYADVELQHIVGHRQVTDTYLAALASHHSGWLATFDQGLAHSHPEVAIHLD